MAASILIADDDAVQRRLVENMVQKCGYEAVVVDSGDALSLIPFYVLLTTHTIRSRSSGPRTRRRPAPASIGALSCPSRRRHPRPVVFC